MKQSEHKLDLFLNKKVVENWLISTDIFKAIWYDTEMFFRFYLSDFIYKVSARQNDIECYWYRENITFYQQNLNFDKKKD